MKLKTTTIFLFLFLLSCTVTKRVHRPGYHIEWRKAYRVQKLDKSDKEEVRRGKSKAKSDNSTTSPGLLTSNLTNEAELSENDTSITFTAISRKETRTSSGVEMQLGKKKFRELPNLKQQARSFFVEQSRKYAPLKMPKSSKKSSRYNSYTSDGFRYIGYVFLGITGYLLLGVLMSYLGFWIMENLFYSLVFSGNGVIAGILGFILFLIILLIVYIAFAIVHYLLGGAYIGFIVSMACLGVGLLCLLIGASV